MKKTRFLALTLVVAIMLIGAGYAQWTDQLVMANTVTTGEMNVEFVEKCGYPSWWACERDGKYITGGIDEKDKKKMSVSFENLYPGSFVAYDALIQNKGTIPAVFDNAVVEFDASSSPELKGKLHFYMAISHYDVDGKYIPCSGRKVAAKSLNELERKLNRLLKEIRLEPGEYISFDIPEEFKEDAAKIIPGYDVNSNNCAYFWLPSSVTNEDNVENKTVKFTMTINWKQHNVQ
ncbi:MAG: hypothetical protein MJB12_07540 [Firmicutes bacterium]|nr:hypothetical protein [Bacillota bacterium]